MLAVFVVYSPVLDAGYIWDDDVLVSENRALRSLCGLWRIWLEPGATAQYYPGTYTSFWLEYQTWGLNPAASHLLNIFLHAASVLLLWRVLSFLEVPGAWLAAALFALHPVYVESVAWISERKNVLSGVLYLASLSAFLRYAFSARRRPSLYAASFVLFLLALFSKTVTCSLPAVLLIVIWWKRGHVSARLIASLLPFFAAGAALGLFTVWMEKHLVGATGPEWDLDWIERCLIAGRALWFYARTLAWPENLTFIYPRWVIDREDVFQYLYPVAALGVVAGLWFMRGRIGRGPIAAVLIFCGTLVPALGFFDVYPMRYSFVADHFQYLASIALLVLFAAGVAQLAEPLGSAGRVLPIVLAAALLPALGFLTWRQAHVYLDRETLWRDTLAKNPGAWIAHVNLGGALAEQQRFEEAIALYERAAQMEPGLPEPLINLGVVHHLEKDHAGALNYLRAALERDPENADARVNLGRVLIAAGDLDQAAHHLAKALERAPKHADAHNQMGIVLKRRGRLPAAERHFREAIRLEPDSAEALNNLGAVMEDRGRTDEAIQYYLAAIGAMPEPSAHVNLGRVFVRRGQDEEAVAHLERALELDPESAYAHRELGRILLRRGNLRGARGHFEAAVRVRPDWPVALNALAWMLATHPGLGDAARRQSVEVAERAVRSSPRRDPSILDTLAAAYAAAGRFDEAVDVAEEALRLARKAGASTLAEEISGRRDLYVRNRSYRVPLERTDVSSSDVRRKR